MQVWQYEYRVTQSVTSCTSTCDTLFLSQCRHSHLDVVQYLCADAGCDVKSEDKRGWTPLHMACLWVHAVVPPFIVCILHQARGKVKLCATVWLTAKGWGPRRGCSVGGFNFGAKPLLLGTFHSVPSSAAKLLSQQAYKSSQHWQSDNKNILKVFSAV